MTINHHATDETLLRHATGQLPAAPAVVVATHLSGCPTCRARVAMFEAAGGAMLDDIDSEPMAPGAFAAALQAIDQPEEPAPVRKRTPSPSPLPDGIPLPAPLRDCEIGPWRWIGFGLRASAVRLPYDPDARLTLLCAGPNRRLPEHGHSGTEFTQILFGSYSDGFGRYMPGDLTEMGSEIEHQPIVDPDSACICLAALEGEMRLTGLLGRLIQPFVRL